MITRFALLFALLVCTGSAVRADVCSQKQNLTFTPSTPLRSVTNGWFQWLNAGTASCSGSSTHLTCTKSGVAYTFDYYCDSSHCYVDAWQGATWRNEAMMGLGDVWNWQWDAWKNAYLQDLWVVCWPSNCSGPNYGTCD